MEGTGNNWPEWIAEIVKWSLAATGTAASSIVLWFAARYKGHLAMLLRHEEILKQRDGELGLFRSFKAAVEKGPLGDELTQEINGLRGENEKLHKRIGRRRLENEKIRRALVGIRSEMKHIKESLERIENK